MENNEQEIDEYSNYTEIADKVRSGEYFRDARSMYDTEVHDPTAQRFIYIALILMSWFIICISFGAWQGFFPLTPRVAFIFATNDIIEDDPKIRTLVNYHGEDSNIALRRFLVQHYVKLREEYDARFFDRNHNAIESLSIPSVREEYEQIISPLSPTSPVSLYQRSILREVNILSTNVIVNDDTLEDKQLYYMRLFFDAVLKKGVKQSEPTRFKVDVAFRYKDIRLDEVTGRIEPYGFVVISYNAKSL